MTLTRSDVGPSLEAVRSRLCGHGLHEGFVGTSYLYSVGEGLAARLLLVLHAVGTGAQVYLFPEALARTPGAAQPFYAALEAAGFGMGSKLGPSISLPLADEQRMHYFWSAFALLMHPQQMGTRHASPMIPARRLPAPTETDPSPAVVVTGATMRVTVPSPTNQPAIAARGIESRAVQASDAAQTDPPHQNMPATIGALAAAASPVDCGLAVPPAPPSTTPMRPRPDAPLAVQP